MHRSLRMVGILQDLQYGPSTLARLAARYECSTKTIQRDIAALVELSIPVISSSGMHGGISLDRSWLRGPLNLNVEEIETLILALEASPHLPAIDSALAKIRAASTPSRFDAVDQSPLRPTMLRRPAGSLPSGVEGIRRIIRRDLWCRIDYDGGSAPGWRTVKPMDLRITDGRWYLAAIDERSREERWFRIERVKDMVPALPPANADDLVGHARSVPDYRSEVFPLVEVALTPAGIRFCEDHTDFFEWIEGDRLRFRCPPREYRYYARELLRMGAECTVIGPPELVAILRSLAMEIAHHLGVHMDDRVS